MQTASKTLNEMVEIARSQIAFELIQSVELPIGEPAVRSEVRGCGTSELYDRKFWSICDRDIRCLWATDIASRFDRILGLARGFVAILRHHRASTDVSKSFVVQLTRYLNVLEEGQFVKRAKYVCAFALAKFCRNTLPEIDVAFTPSGIFGRWARARFNARTRTNCHLWSSWNQAKRSALPVSDGIILSNFCKHRDRMVAKDPAADDDELADAVSYVLRPVTKMLKHELEGLKWNERRSTSLRASYENSRSSGGAQIEIARCLGLFGAQSADALDQSEDWRTMLHTDFEGYEDDRPRFTGRYMTAQPRVRRTCHLDLDAWRKPGAESWWCSLGESNDSLLEKLARERCKPGSEPLRCKVQAVVEPLKVRTITAGEAVPYHLSGDCQKAMHSVMRRMLCFRLIGRSASPTDLMDLVTHLVDGKDSRGCEHKWLSLDYEASTDNISRRLSELVCNEIVDGLDMADVFRSCLAVHTCEYPKIRLDPSTLGGALALASFELWADEHPGCFVLDYDVIGDDGFVEIKLSDATQVNAQLMGSRMSFVILCLINLALIIVAHVEAEREWNPGFVCDVTWILSLMRRILINGDDALFACSPSVYQQMVKMGKRVGLPLSVGKVYYDAVYANINSTSYWYDFAQPGATPRQIDYLNVGLLFGQNKVLASDDEGESRLISTIPRVLSGCLPGRQSDVLKDFLGLHAEQLKVESKRRNFFIHPSLGGWGIPLPDGWKFDVTRAQLAEVRDRLSRLGETAPCARPFFDKVVERTDEFVLFTPWRDTSPKTELEELNHYFTGRRSLTWSEVCALQVGVVSVVVHRKAVVVDDDDGLEGVESDAYRFHNRCRSLTPLW